MLTKHRFRSRGMLAACVATLSLLLLAVAGAEPVAAGPRGSVLSRDGKPLFALGMYERPRNDGEWERWQEAGINLIRARSWKELDENWEYGMFGTVHVNMILDDSDYGQTLTAIVNTLKDHPALVAWEAPDEAIWWAWRLERAVPPRFWGPHEDVAPQAIARMEALVRGLIRGAEMIRKLDPDHYLWLNEACQSSQASLARVAPWLDIIGFDYYPIPNGTGSPMEYMGLYVDRFHQTAPQCDLWAVQQAFSWGSLPNREGRYAFPTRKEIRFMAWQAIAYGATGILWWGSRYEDNRIAITSSVMEVVSELSQLHPFLTGAPINSVRVSNDPNRHPWLLGGRAVVRRDGDRTLLALINQDGTPADLIIQGLDWLDVKDLRPMTPVSSDLTPISDGIITMMDGFEVRIYVADPETTVDEEKLAELPSGYEIHQNAPNPFNAETTIQYSIPRDGPVRLDIRNLAGQKVASLVDGAETAGDHSASWDGRDERGRDLGSGVYLYSLQAGNRIETRKLLLLR